MNRVKKLKKQIGVVSTGGPLPKEREELGLQSILNLGFEYFQPFSSSKYYADYTYGFANGSPEARIAAIKDCLSNDSVDVLLSARGATGSLEILKNIPYDLWVRSRKSLVGDSDVTSLLVHLAFNCDLPTIHGSTLGASFADYNSKNEAKISVDSLILMLTDENYRQEYEFRNISNYNSPVEGKLLCGNLTMLCALLGTPFDTDYSDKIIVIEEVGESPYRVQRMLNQLSLAGKFENVNGICFGRFSKCETKVGPDIEEILNSFSQNKSFRFPISFGLEVGHWGKNLPVPLGCMAKITDTRLIQLESPLEIS